MAVADTWSKAPVEGTKYLGLTNNRADYVWTDAQGNIIGNANNFSGVQTPQMSAYGSGITPPDPRVYYNYLASGTSASDPRVRGAAYDMAKNEAQNERQIEGNKAYDAAAKGDLTGLRALGLAGYNKDTGQLEMTDRAKEVMGTAPKYDTSKAGSPYIDNSEMAAPRAVSYSEMLFMGSSNPKIGGNGAYTPPQYNKVEYINAAARNAGQLDLGDAVARGNKLTPSQQKLYDMFEADYEKAILPRPSKTKAKENTEEIFDMGLPATMTNRKTGVTTTTEGEPVLEVFGPFRDDLTQTSTGKYKLSNKDTMNVGSIDYLINSGLSTEQAQGVANVMGGDTSPKFELVRLKDGGSIMADSSGGAGSSIFSVTETTQPTRGAIIERAQNPQGNQDDISALLGRVDTSVKVGDVNVPVSPTFAITPERALAEPDLKLEYVTKAQQAEAEKNAGTITTYGPSKPDFEGATFSQSDPWFRKSLYSDPSSGEWGNFLKAHPDAMRYDKDRSNIIDNYYRGGVSGRLEDVKIDTEATLASNLIGGAANLAAASLSTFGQFGANDLTDPNKAYARVSSKNSIGELFGEPFTAKYVSKTYAGGPTSYSEYASAVHERDYLRLQEQQNKAGINPIAAGIQNLGMLNLQFMSGGLYQPQYLTGKEDTDPLQATAQNVAFALTTDPNLPITPAFFEKTGHMLGGVSQGGYLLFEEPSDVVATGKMKQTGKNIEGTFNPILSNLAFVVAAEGIPATLKGASNPKSMSGFSKFIDPFIPAQTQSKYGAASEGLLKGGMTAYSGAVSAWKYDENTKTWNFDLPRGIAGAAIAAGSFKAADRLSAGQDLGAGIKDKLLQAPTKANPKGESVTWLSIMDRPIISVYKGRIGFGKANIGADELTALTQNAKGDLYQIGGGEGAVGKEVAAKFENPIEQFVKGRSGGPSEYRMMKNTIPDWLGKRPLETTSSGSEYGIKELFQKERFAKGIKQGEEGVARLEGDILTGPEIRNPIGSMKDVIKNKPQTPEIQQAMGEWAQQWKGRVKIGGGTAEEFYPDIGGLAAMRPKGIKPSADIDAVINEKAMFGKGMAIRAKESAMAKLKKNAPNEKFRSEEDAGLIEWYNQKTGTWENLFDIHGQGVVEPAGGEAAAYVFGKKFTPRYIREPSGGAIATSGTLGIANLGAVSIMTASGLGTASHRAKDLAKHPFIQEGAIDTPWKREKAAKGAERMFRNSNYGIQSEAIDYLQEKGYPLKSYMGEPLKSPKPSKMNIAPLELFSPRPASVMPSQNRKTSSSRASTSLSQAIGSISSPSSSSSRTSPSRSAYSPSISSSIGSPSYQSRGSPSRSVGSPSRSFGSPSRSFGSPSKSIASPSKSITSPSNSIPSPSKSPPSPSPYGSSGSTGGPPPNFPDLGGGLFGGNKVRQTKARRYGYTPDITAALFGITSRKANVGGALTGYGIRPILISGPEPRRAAPRATRASQPKQARQPKQQNIDFGGMIGGGRKRRKGGLDGIF